MASTTLEEVTVAILGPSDINSIASKIEKYVTEYENSWNATRTDERDERIRLETRRYNREIPYFRQGWDGQTFVNNGLLAQADIVIVVFNRTPGTPYEDPKTHAEYESATDYEITLLEERYAREGKPAIHIYFPKSYTSETWRLLQYRNKLAEPGSGFMIGEWDNAGGTDSDERLKTAINDLLQKDITSILRGSPSPDPVSGDWVGKARDILAGLPGIDGRRGERITQPDAVKNLNDGGVSWRELRFDKASEMICELKKRGVVEFDGEKGGQPIIQVILPATESKEPEIRRFAYLNWGEALPQLARLALPEMWGFGFDPDDFGILRNYLTYTFERVKLEDKILFTDRNAMATFNTGLISRKGNDIYMTFTPNEHPYFKWRFYRFEEIPYGRGLLGNSLSGLPERPTYGNESDFRFDTNLEIRINIDKIIQSALNRLPMAYLKEIAGRNHDLLHELDSRNPNWKVISEIVASDRIIRGYLEMDFNIARDNVRAMARANAHLPIPFYYPKDRKIEFLLPLDLDWDPMNWSVGEKTKMLPQAVLVLERQQKNNDDYYQVHGLLDLRMAYIDARLLGRQDNTWLDAETIFRKR